MEQKKRKKRETISHTIRTKDGGTVTIKGYTRKQSVKIYCVECCGWESNPKNCEIKLCALWPFRGRINASLKGDYGKR